MPLLSHLVLTTCALACAATQAANVNAFADNFQNGLGQWTDRNPGNPESHIVNDP